MQYTCTQCQFVFEREPKKTAMPKKPFCSNACVGRYNSKMKKKHLFNAGMTYE